jgi:glycosyltransferase involved in cell wall biosynthesis
MPPSISIIMPVWNGEVHLREAVDSILGQSFRDFEFLILDDGSTDRTPAILDEYAESDERIRIIRLAHQGIVVALNRGVAEAHAKWIARMDCDDIAHPKRLELQIKALEANPRAVLCYTDVRPFNELGHSQGSRHLPKSDALLKAYLCYSPPFVHPTVIFARSSFLAAGGYLQEERHAEDFGLWGRLISEGEFIGIPESLLDFRIHQGSISKQKMETQREVSKRISAIHCGRFLDASENEVEAIISILRGENGREGIKDWIWFGKRFLTRLKPQSIELWAWFFSQAIRRSRREFCNSKAGS